MKKVFVSICIAGAALAMSSCRSVEKAIPLSSINGEWNIIEVNGSKITPDGWTNCKDTLCPYLPSYILLQIGRASCRERV